MKDADPRANEVRMKQRLRWANRSGREQRCPSLFLVATLGLRQRSVRQLNIGTVIPSHIRGRQRSTSKSCREQDARSCA